MRHKFVKKVINAVISRVQLNSLPDFIRLCVESLLVVVVLECHSS